MYHHRLLLPVVLAALMLSAAAAGPAVAAPPVRMNEVQVIGTHNSYHREMTQAERPTYDAAHRHPGDYDAYLAYSHATIPNQFARQDVRGLELDLSPDPQGGLYANPVVRQRDRARPAARPGMAEPGIKIFHVADLDYNTTCVRCVDVPRAGRAWSDANPRHVPLPIMLELKQSDPRGRGGRRRGAPVGRGAPRTLDAEIRSVFRDRDLITARRHPAAAAARSSSRSSARLAGAREQPAARCVPARQRPGRDPRRLHRRAPEPRGPRDLHELAPGFQDAAFIKRNEPRNTNTAQIPELVRDGYLIRTRSDVPLTTVTSRDTSHTRGRARQRRPADLDRLPARSG